VLAFGNIVIALVLNQGCIRQQKAIGAAIEIPPGPALALSDRISGLGVVDTGAAWLAAILKTDKVLLPELSIKQVSWKGLEEYATRFPYKVKVNILCYRDSSRSR
jgi:hypothetical protein